jgi:hypothetical protein
MLVDWTATTLRVGVRFFVALMLQNRRIEEVVSWRMGFGGERRNNIIIAVEYVQKEKYTASGV